MNVPRVDAPAIAALAPIRLAQKLRRITFGDIVFPVAWAAEFPQRPRRHSA